MEKKKVFQLRKGSMSAKIALIVVIVLCTAALITLRLSTRQLQQNTAAMRDQAAYMEEKNAQMIQDVEDVGSIESIIHLAEEKLGLVEPGTVLFTDKP